MATAQDRTMRIEATISSDAMAVVQRAAEIEGRSVSDFIAAAAHEAAQRTIEATHLIQLSVEEQRRFVDLLLDPPGSNQALERAKEAHARLIQPPR